jgi:hypothetical protein
MDSYGKNMYYIHKYSKMGVCLNEYITNVNVLFDIIQKHSMKIGSTSTTN